MIVINARVETTADQIEAVRGILSRMEAASRSEDGCEEYSFSVDLNAPDVLRITERWRDADALRAHFQSDHMAAFNRAIAEQPLGKLELHCYEAQEIPLITS